MRIAKGNKPAMARLSSSKIVDSDSDDSLPEISTIFSAKSIATPKKNLVPRASSAARLVPRSNGEEAQVAKPRRRVLGKATDNSLLRRLGRNSPALGVEEGRKREKGKGLGKTLFDEVDELPTARRAAGRAAAVRRRIADIPREEEESGEEDDEEEVESTYVRPRAVRRAPVKVEQRASAKEQAVQVKPKTTRNVLEDFGNLTIQAESESEEEVLVKARPTRTRRLVRKQPSPPPLSEQESEEEDQQEHHDEEEMLESEDEVVRNPQPERAVQSIPMVVLRAYERSDSSDEDDDEGKSAAQVPSEPESEDEPVVKPRPNRRTPLIRQPSPTSDSEPKISDEENGEDEIEVPEASCLEDDFEVETVPKAVPRMIPQGRLSSSVFNALQHLPPPRILSPRLLDDEAQEGEEEDSDEEHLNILEVSCLEDDDEGEVEEAPAEVYEHQESEEDEEEDDSEEMSDFVVSDEEEEASVSGSDLDASEDESPEKPEPRSVRCLIKGRRNASPSPPSSAVSRQPVVDFQWSDDDREEEKRPAATSRTLLPGTGRSHKKSALPTLSDSEDETSAPVLNPQTPSDSDDDLSAKDRTPRSTKKQRDPSKRLKSPTKPKFPRLPAISPPRRQSTDAFWEPEVINKWHDEYSPQKSLFPSPTKTGKPISKLRLGGGDEVIDVDLLKSPTKAHLARLKKAEKDAIKEFEASKTRIAMAFLSELDQKVCAGEIARMSASTGGVQLIWSAKLNTTAGRAHWRREGRESSYRHHCSIELASKVISDTHRLINVLAHEFCHLATFMISRELKNPHGKEFKAWGSKVEEVFGERDIVVSTKHSYQIAWRYLWQCQTCRRDVGRHSRSVDPKRMRCGACKGELVQIKPVPRGGAVPGSSLLFPAAGRDGDSAFFGGQMGETKTGGQLAKPKQLTEYQAFVKGNMARIKAENPGSPMKEVMGLVGAKYREEKEGRRLFAEGGRLKQLKVGRLETEGEGEVDKMMKGVEVLDLTSP